ncbi:CDP-alcohol phosphatidyltransferase family protein [Nocardioides marmotae]|uniref:Phosphatidylcholine synthase n=1 Tax=Nocardioides marmotae TaxID=2663857 RepID=A0A6I3J4X3_9ACTN|nr:CDP-alcohol phosphatidyltransferase family protein [Nocardioides marmotae]MCR6030566.1 CDP-diacylglycerol O-phosphatidyltransferase [Gordonia jinghuaiqii]MBC9734950.1 CDP-alcohol phosphatidyltransferase family protein [Nocardioides marmotae]MTB86049.1 CDP-diacylglycerol O-phosphatidyltransferase [Nocardioides marmotae]MTB94202.1 CDP-diacylglycerol O-phosphatidyltransferase [Nocardioides marmotae]QKE00489.1 CDP-diacylglycerol O-phosphatidyltransferase [Nocardioides marmotae]
MARAAAWMVHAYTMSGAVLGLLMVHLSYQGEVEAVLWLFLVAMLVDGTDGFLARRFRVKEVVPEIDGALLDNIVDYLTYAFAPMILLWATGRLPDGAWGAVVAAVPLVASCYQFCRSDAKTEDHYFRGFPSYWNIVAFHVFVLDLSVTATVVLLLVLAVLVYVPVRYVYPSRTEALWGLNMTLATAWLAVYALLVLDLPDPSTVLVGASLAYVAYYTAVSGWLTLSGRRREAAITSLA